MAKQGGTGAVVLLLLLLAWPPLEAQQKAPARQAPAHPMREAQVGDPAVGKQLFQKKGCIKNEEFNTIFKLDRLARFLAREKKERAARQA